MRQTLPVHICRLQNWHGPSSLSDVWISACSLPWDSGPSSGSLMPFCIRSEISSPMRISGQWPRSPLIPCSKRVVRPAGPLVSHGRPTRGPNDCSRMLMRKNIMLRRTSLGGKLLAYVIVRRLGMTWVSIQHLWIPSRL